MNSLRPQLFSAIPEAAQRGDLVSRSIAVTPPSMSKNRRLTEAEFWAEADCIRPTVLGALLTGVAYALRHRDDPAPPELPRMADFASFMWRAAPGLGWEPKALLDAYAKNQVEGAQIVFEAEGLGAAIVDLLALRNPREWEGTATELLQDLPVDEKGRKAKW